jgi:translin
MNPERLLSRARNEFRAWDEQRETLLVLGRELTRASGRLIQAWHRGEERETDWNALDATANKILQAIEKTPWFRHSGFVQQALGEYAEATLLRDAKGSDALLAKLTPDALLLGIADTIGELRRRVLDLLLKDDIKQARKGFDQMESLFAALLDVDAPDPLVPARAKRDQARGILERTRGDLVTTKKTKDLEKKVDTLGDLLDEAEGRAKPKKKKADAEDLDLDGAWGKS